MHNHNLGFGAICFFGLRCFSSCVELCGVGFFAQPFVGSMLSSVGVVVQLCWVFYSVICKEPPAFNSQTIDQLFYSFSFSRHARVPSPIYPARNQSYLLSNIHKQKAMLKTTSSACCFAKDQKPYCSNFGIHIICNGYTNPKPLK
jgi:hypothetical protein